MNFLFCLTILFQSAVQSTGQFPGQSQTIARPQQLCDPNNPCPPGTTCIYSRTTPGTKVCSPGIRSVQKRPGRCPISSGSVPSPITSMIVGSRPCQYDQDCPPI